MSPLLIKFSFIHRCRQERAKRRIFPEWRDGDIHGLSVRDVDHRLSFPGGKMNLLSQGCSKQHPHVGFRRFPWMRRDKHLHRMFHKRIIRTGTKKRTHQENYQQHDTCSTAKWFSSLPSFFPPLLIYLLHGHRLLHSVAE